VQNVCALPLLGIAYWLKMRHPVGFMLLASLAAIPVEHYASNPMNAWRPTVEQLEHGFYLDAFLPCVLLASATGAMFALGIRQKEKPNQLPERMPLKRPGSS